MRSSASFSNAGRAAFFLSNAECAYTAVVAAFASSFVGRRAAAGLSPARCLPHEVRRCGTIFKGVLERFAMAICIFLSVISRWLVLDRNYNNTFFDIGFSRCAGSMA